MTGCPHHHLAFAHKFAVRGRERLYQVDGHCADCGAALEFLPAPTLSLDDRNLQIPFRLGAPDPLRPLPVPSRRLVDDSAFADRLPVAAAAARAAEGGPMTIGGRRKGMH